VPDYKVEIPDYGYWKKQIKCQEACPVHTDSGGYVRAIAEGNYELAYLIARGPNPLASICGRVCGAPCEASCRRGSVDEAVSIRALKRFVIESLALEGDENLAEKFFHRLKNFISPQKCSAGEELAALKDFLNSAGIKKPQGEKIAIIGSGPAGLAAAHDLCLLGLRPVIFEMEPVPAGMLYLGVPEYRLPREIIEAEVEVIKSLGTEIKCNIQVGKDITLEEIRKEYKATLIAVGAKKSAKIPIPGVDAKGVIGGVELLRSVALGEEVKLGEKVIVIGGGNVAYDVARTVVRQAEYDVSRTALRQESVKEVKLYCLESLEEMPADDVEINEGDEEGVSRHNSWGPVEIILDNGRARGVKFKKCLSVYDENKRFSPVFDEANIMDSDADTVILSIGQVADLSFIDSDRDKIKLTERGQIVVNPETLQSSSQDVFVAGDIAHGTKLMIDAISSGKQAARSMFEKVTGKKLEVDRKAGFTLLENYDREKDYEKFHRTHPPTAHPSERKDSVKVTVEKGYPEKQAVREGVRCYSCDIQTIFHSERCILCAGCEDVCPLRCLRVVRVESIRGDEKLEKLLHRRYGENAPKRGSAVIKDETECIRCGLCAKRCPALAITMEQFKFKESYSVK